MSGNPLPWREPPPSAHELIRWPTGFGRRYLVWCDVEEEFDWHAPFSRGAHSTANIAMLPAMDARLRAHGISPIYMVDYPVARSSHAAALIAPLLDGGAALGAQLHPWVNPPFDEPLGEAQSFLGNLPRAVQAAKIDALTAALTAAFGRAPAAFRAGRYGIGADTRQLLAERGYRIDSSVRARHDYRATCGPDFTAVGNAAYRRDGLVELPLTTAFTGIARRAGPTLFPIAAAIPKAPGALARAGLVNRVPLTPEGVPLAEAVAAVDAALADGERLLSLSFHSPSLAPGNTPFVRDAADLARFHRWWDGMLDHLAARSFQPCSLDEVIAATAKG